MSGGPAWPEAPDSRDPWPEPWSTTPAAWQQRLADAWTGRSDGTALRAAARLAELDAPLQADPREWPAPPWLPTEADLACITTDLCPQAGNEAPDRVLGPWASELLPRRVLQVAVALATFFPGDDNPRTPFRQWRRRKPRPSVEARSAVRALARVPLAPWRLVEQVADGRWHLDTPLALGPGSTPRTPVTLRTPGALDDGHPDSGRWVLARVVLGPLGWVATCPLLVPARPHPPRWMTWLEMLGWEERAAGADPTLDGLLRRRGHVLARRILEQAWGAR